MKKWNGYLSIGAVMLVMTVAAMLTFNVSAQPTKDDTIPDRVYFGSISGGGMGIEEATEAIEDYVDSLADTKITLTAGENMVETTVGELGLSWSNPEIVEEASGLGKSGNLIVRYKAKKDLEHEDKVYTIAYSVDAEKITGVLESSLEELNKKAIDAQLKRESGGFTIIPGVQGVEVNVEASVASIQKYFAEAWKEQETNIELMADITEPRGKEEDLRLVKDVLGSFNTNFADSAAGRVKNVTRGANLINGSLIYPGDQFSVYEAVSPFTPENGYELAGAYENGQTIKSYGGGICQVSTTLYNAAIRAELDIVERYAHSMIVTYVEPSADAAIAGTYKDLKFVNNTDAPIYIEGYTSGRTIYFTIFGHETRPKNRSVSFYSETISQSDPGAKFQATNAPIGTITRTQGVHPGKTAKLWKIVKVDGVEKSREVFNNSNYQASPAIYAVGVSSANPEAVAAINAALATQDEATIRAAAAAWNDAALALQQQQQQEQQQQQQQQEQQEQQQQQEQEAETNKEENDKDKDKDKNNDKNDKDNKVDSDKGSAGVEETLKEDSSEEAGADEGETN